MADEVYKAWTDDIDVGKGVVYIEFRVLIKTKTKQYFFLKSQNFFVFFFKILF